MNGVNGQGGIWKSRSSDVAVSSEGAGPALAKLLCN